MSKPLAYRSLSLVVASRVWYAADEHGCMQYVQLPDGRVYEFAGTDTENMTQRAERRKNREESRLHGLQTSQDTPPAKLGW